MFVHALFLEVSSQLGDRHVQPILCDAVSAVIPRKINALAVPLKPVQEELDISDVALELAGRGGARAADVHDAAFGLGQDEEGGGEDGEGGVCDVCGLVLEGERERGMTAHLPSG